jgi:hypothetical protein
VTDSPFILAGILIVIAAILFGIIAAIVRSRSENNYTSAPSKSQAALYTPSYGQTSDAEPIDSPTSSSSALDVLARLSGTDTAETLDEPPEHVPSAAEVRAFPPPSEVIEDLRDTPIGASWTNIFTGDDGPLEPQERLDIVHRLEIVGEPWCIDTLRAAFNEEADPQVHEAVRLALEHLAPSAG